jgi:hypothetical protein
LRDLTAAQEEDTAFVTEQFLPRKQDAVFGDPFVFQTLATNQHIRARLIMLSPFPSDTAPLAKSVAYLSSRFGSIKAEIVSASHQVVTWMTDPTEFSNLGFFSFVHPAERITSFASIFSHAQPV